MADDITRIGATAVKEMLDRGEHVQFVDARNPDAWASSAVKLPGAIRVLPDELPARRDEIPRDHAVITYCTCPHEASAAKVARQLTAWGWSRAEPLAGGLDAWIAAGYPTAPK